MASASNRRTTSTTMPTGRRASHSHGRPPRTTTQAKTVIRGGYGWFFDRFTEGNILQSIRQNGITQQQYVIQNPAFYQNAPAASQLAASSTAANTIYTIAPNLKAAVNMQAALGVEHHSAKSPRSPPPTSTPTVTRTTRQHQCVHPSTYDATTGTGTRPNGITRTSISSSPAASTTRTRSWLNYTVRAKRLSLFGFYMLNFAKADTSGASYFPSNQTDPSADYGRANFDVHNRSCSRQLPGAVWRLHQSHAGYQFRHASTSPSARILTATISSTIGRIRHLGQH